ncbi:HigA family addiction module antitoxin [Rhodoblastus sp.]|uniref:HigA family addiction module antitoxin n=1 Tax=Rhodoblastus sp. TaxID=1962975 RepID=UPI003F99E353
MAKLTTRHPAMAPSHPGELLREIILPALPNTKKEVAETLGVSRQTLDKLLNEQQRVTPDIAARLGKVFGNGPGIWLRMQAAVDTHKAEQIDVSGLRVLEVA